jgi:hypothetical protein
MVSMRDIRTAHKIVVQKPEEKTALVRLSRR